MWEWAGDQRIEAERRAKMSGSIIPRVWGNSWRLRKKIMLIFFSLLVTLDRPAANQTLPPCGQNVSVVHSTRNDENQAKPEKKPRQEKERARVIHA
jgi:hypothetical protein